MDISKLSIDELLTEARELVSGYCLTKCDYSCCANRFPLRTKNPSDVKAIFELDNSVNLEDFAKIKKELKILDFTLRDKEYQIIQDICPQLDGKICKLYYNTARPESCKQYPIIKRGRNIMLFSECSAIKNKQLDNYYNCFKTMGYKVMLLQSFVHEFLSNI